MEEKNTIEERILSPDERLPDTDRLLGLIEDKRYNEFRRIVSDIPAVDIAEFFDKMPKEYYVPAYRLLPKEVAAEAFVEMGSELKEHLINSFTDSELSATLEELYIDDTVDMIEEMPAAVVKRILRNSRGEERDVINKLLNYPKDTAGTIMTTEYVRFTKEMTVEDAVEIIQAKVGLEDETIEFLLLFFGGYND